MPVSARTCFLCGTAHFTTQRCPAKRVGGVVPDLPAGVTKGLVVKKAAVSNLVAAKPAQPAGAAGKKPPQKITENITAPVVGLATDEGTVAVETLEGWRARALAAEAALEARRSADRDRTAKRRKKVGP